MRAHRTASQLLALLAAFVPSSRADDLFREEITKLSPLIYLDASAADAIAWPAFEPGPTPAAGFNGFEKTNRAARLAPGPVALPAKLAPDLAATKPSAFTIACWVRVPAGTGARAVIFHRGSDARIQFELAVENGRFVFSCDHEDGGQRAITAASTSPANGTWQFVAVVLNKDGRLENSNGALQLFVNGRIAAKGATRNQGHTSAWRTAAPVCLGARPDGSQPFAGALDAFAIWPRALTEKEIQNLYNVATIVPEPTVIIVGSAPADRKFQ